MRKLKKATDTASESSAAPAYAPAAATGPIGFSANRKELLAAVRRVSAFTDRHSSMPVLADLAIKAASGHITIAATDLNHAAAHSCPAWFARTPGMITVNAKAFGDLLKRLPDGDVTVRAADGHTVEVAIGTLTVTMEGRHARDYPKLPAILPDDPALDLVTVDAGELIRMIDAVKYAVCKDETRFHLNGILLESDGETARMVATDGHRLAKVVGQLAGFRLAAGLILPFKAVTELGKLLRKGTAEIGMLGASLVVRQSGTTVAIQPIDAQFPPYAQVIPTDNRRLVTVDRAALSAALKRAALVCTETRGVKLECVPDGLKLTCDHPDIGTASETIPAELNPAGSFVLGANAKYLIDAISAIDDERVTLAFSTDDSPAKWAEGHKTSELCPMLVRGTEDASTRSVVDSALVCVVMPMRI